MSKKKKRKRELKLDLGESDKRKSLYVAFFDTP